jgi:hypothetical protein
MKKIIISFVSILVCVVCFGQTLSEVPKKCVAFKPDVLYTSLLKSSDANNLAKSSDFGQTTSSRKNKERWVVYSDRDNNITYTAPKSSTKYSALRFNEQVCIALIRNGWALVYTEPKMGEIYPKISKDATFRGWVPMSKLLLWDSCPVNDKNIYNKAMICANIDQNVKNGNLGKLFKNPTNTSNYTALSTNFVYYFEMKREDKMVLLAKENSLNGTSSQVLFGWVDENSFVAWNQRTCLEPTWEIEDVEYFIENNVTVPIYADANRSSKAASVGYEKKIAENYDPYLYRMDGNILRYPILDKNTSTLWNCSTFSSPGTSGGTINQGTTTAKGTNIITQVTDEMKNIKIAIVIDGTRSMERYYAPVKEAIKQVTDYFDKAQQVKVKVGVVIYRDYADGDFATEIFPMTDPKNPQLAKWLDSGGKGGVKSSPKDKTFEEAMFLGINTAIDKFNFNPKESNFMFVIGDCGNDPNDTRVTRETIINKLVAKNINLVGFQVRNYSESPAFGFFNAQLQYIMKESLTKRYAAYPSMKNKRIVPQKVNDGYNFEPDNTSGSTFFYASHRYVQKGDMPADKLQDLMTNAFTYVQSTVAQSATIIINAGDVVQKHEEEVKNNFGKGESGGTATTMEYDFLVQRLGKEYVESLKKLNTTVSFRGFTPKADDSDRDYYKTVIFISQEEFNTLMIRLKDLYTVAQAKSNDRAPYVTAMKALIQGMIPGITDEEMQKMDINEVMKLISGVNVQTTTMKKRTLAEVASTAAVKPAEYLSILNDFKIKYQRLQSIKSNPYKYVRKFNGATYYWIPTEDLP